MCVPTNTHIYKCTYIACTCTYTNIWPYICAHINTYIHSHIHRYICTYTHIIFKHKTMWGALCHTGTFRLNLSWIDSSQLVESIAKIALFSLFSLRLFIWIHMFVVCVYICICVCMFVCIYASVCVCTVSALRWRVKSF